jgi:uncharacterized protein (TIGR03083 family)
MDPEDTTMEPATKTMDTAETWKLIHAERSDVADTLTSLAPTDWSRDSWCAGWTVAEVGGHILAAAEQTPLHFYTSLLSAGLRFNTMMDRDARRLGAVGHGELIERLRARTSTTNHPPAPVVTMLGEIVVHGEDIRRPLGRRGTTPEVALVAVADSYKRSNLLIGAKRRIAGTHLRATDVAWEHGDGADVSGPLSSLILVMTGRRQALADLEGPGVSILRERC